MTKNRAETTLFVLASVDGKISTGNADERDTDCDFPKIKGIREGLFQYYKLQKKTDYWSLNTGRVMEKIGANAVKGIPSKLGNVSFVIVDNKPHLQKSGINYLAGMLKSLYVVTTNKNHPAVGIKKRLKNIEIIYYPDKVDFEDLLAKLKKKHGAKRVTIQSGSTLNAVLLRKKLIDHISIVVAPALIGGSTTPSIIGGPSLSSERDLNDVKALRLRKCKVLKDSYIHLFYDVINNTQIIRR